ncbi:MAG: hypothetical protein ACFFCS_26730 [Candidatus Hodarchaeota archaeon]
MNMNGTNEENKNYLVMNLNNRKEMLEGIRTDLEQDFMPIHALKRESIAEFKKLISPYIPLHDIKFKTIKLELPIEEINQEFIEYYLFLIEKRELLKLLNAESSSGFIKGRLDHTRTEPVLDLFHEINLIENKLDEYMKDLDAFFDDGEKFFDNFFKSAKL